MARPVNKQDLVARQIEIPVPLDRRQAEALVLEMRHLARRFNLEVETAEHVRPATGEDDPPRA